MDLPANNVRLLISQYSINMTLLIIYKCVIPAKRCTTVWDVVTTLNQYMNIFIHVLYHTCFTSLNWAYLSFMPVLGWNNIVCELSISTTHFVPRSISENKTSKLSWLRHGKWELNVGIMRHVCSVFSEWQPPVWRAVKSRQHKFTLTSPVEGPYPNGHFHLVHSGHFWREYHNNPQVNHTIVTLLISSKLSC